MTKKYKVYAGYYELFITDKTLTHTLVLVEEFDTMEQAENYVEERGDWLWIDKDLVDDCSFSLEGDDYDNHIFNAENYI